MVGDAGQPLVRAGPLPERAQGRGEGRVGQVGFPFVAGRGDGGRPPAARVLQKCFSQARLANARLAYDGRDAAGRGDTGLRVA